MSKNETLKTLLNCENLNAQQISHKLSVYGNGRMCQGIKNIFADGVKKGRIEGIIFAGCAVVGVGIGYLIIDYKEKREQERENNKAKQQILANIFQGENNEQKI